MSNNLTFENAKKALAQSGEFYNKTTGVSMYPMLRSGRDIIVVKPADFPLKKHDVPLYRREGTDKLILHRIIKKPVGKTYIIRGDNTYHYEYVEESDIVGVLDGFFRNGKYHNCKTDKLYHVYIILMRIFYPARYLWKSYFVPLINKTKRLLLKILRNKKV